MSKLKQILKKILFFILYRDKDIYYKDNYNSLNFTHLLIWNIFGDIIGGAKILTTNEVTQLVNHEGAELVDIRNQKYFQFQNIM